LFSRLIAVFGRAPDTASGPNLSRPTVQVRERYRHRQAWGETAVASHLPPGWNRLGVSDPVPPIFRSNAENTHARPYEGVYAPPELPQAQPPPVPEMYLGPGLGRHQRLFGGLRLGVLDRVLQRALDGDLHRLFVRRQCPAPE